MGEPGSGHPGCCASGQWAGHYLRGDAYRLTTSRLTSGLDGCGIRYADRDDLILVEIGTGSVSAAVFTRNRFCAAPVQVAKQHIAAAQPKYLVINSGNANAGTGAAGIDAAYAVCRAVAELTGCRADQVLPFSTGVIGETLPVERIIDALSAAYGALSADGWLHAAQAMMTTDTVPKHVSVRFEVDGAVT